MNSYSDEYSDGTNAGGWEASDMQEYVNYDIYNALPSDKKNIILDTTVVSGHGVDTEQNYVTTDKLYLLSTKEIYEIGAAVGYEEFIIDYFLDTSRELTRQLDYYDDIMIQAYGYDMGPQYRCINCEKLIKSNSEWYLRTANSGNYYSFYQITSGGGCDGWAFSYDELGVSPAFRIG